MDGITGRANCRRQDSDGTAKKWSLSFGKSVGIFNSLIKQKGIGSADIERHEYKFHQSPQHQLPSVNSQLRAPVSRSFQQLYLQHELISNDR